MGGIRRVPGLEIANAAQREIDEQLATLLDNVCVLKRQRNACAYISRLPSEILCRIFEIARDTDHLRHPRPESCVIITHVCSAWRDIAIRFPGLWNRITPNYRFPWVEEMMVRSGTAPLRIHVDPAHELHILPTVLSAGAVERLQELTISGLHFPATLKMQCPSMFDTSAPLLERFNITFAPVSFDARGGDVMLGTLFCKGTPRLYHLSLNNCLLPWNSPIYRSPLTFLKLALARNSTSVLPWSIDQLATMLQNLQTLEYLELQNVIPVFDRHFASPEPAQRVIALPRLAKLSITCHTFGQCSLLLDRLALIPISNIRLECSTHEEPFGRPPHLSFSSLSNLLRLQHGTEREAGSILSAEWTFDRTSFMTLALWRETRPTYGKPFLELVLPVYAPNLVAIPAVLGALPLDALDHISFFQNFPQAWISALTPFERVTSVFIRDIEPGAGIVAALAHPTPTPTVGRSEETPLRFLFPALANLTISQCSLLNGLRDHEHSLFAELYAMLETRRGNGCGIATLMLKACEVTEVQLMKLRQVVGTVVCHREDLNTVVVASPDGIDGERFD